MIPHGGTAAVRLETTPADLSAYGVSPDCSTTPTIAKIESPNAEEIAFESIAAVGPASIQAKIGSRTEAVLNVAVKAERVVTVRLVQVLGVDRDGKAYNVQNGLLSWEKARGVLPNAQQLQEYLNGIYGPQANVRFEVSTYSSEVPLMYVNKNGRLLIRFSPLSILRRSSTTGMRRTVPQDKLQSIFSTSMVSAIQ